MDQETFLDDSWNLYFHNPDDNDWTINSYIMIGTVTTVEDWCKANLAFCDIWQKGMFFLMKQDIMPLWEDPMNKEGGCFSFKVNKNETSLYWFDIVCDTLANKLGKDEKINENITGVSITPKRNYCIVRIWLSTKKYNTIQYYNINIPQYTQVMYKNHNDNNGFTS